VNDTADDDAEIQKLICELVAEHGVALDRSDPIVVLHTATRRILRNALLEARQNLGEAMAQHRSELELAASKWQSDSKRSASQLVEEVRSSITRSVSQELVHAAGAAAAHVGQALLPHEKALARATMACALAGAVAVLAAGAIVWTSSRASVRSDVSCEAPLNRGGAR
jgi:hypothetical protein